MDKKESERAREREREKERERPVAKQKARREANISDMSTAATAPKLKYTSLSRVCSEDTKTLSCQTSKTFAACCFCVPFFGREAKQTNGNSSPRPQTETVSSKETCFFEAEKKNAASLLGRNVLYGPITSYHYHLSPLLRKLNPLFSSVCDQAEKALSEGHMIVTMHFPICDAVTGNDSLAGNTTTCINRNSIGGLVLSWIN